MLLSTPTTAEARESKKLTISDPIKPLEPVTRTFIGCSNLRGTILLSIGERRPPLGNVWQNRGDRPIEATVLSARWNVTGRICAIGICSPLATISDTSGFPG